MKKLIPAFLILGFLVFFKVNPVLAQQKSLGDSSRRLEPRRFRLPPSKPDSNGVWVLPYRGPRRVKPFVLPYSQQITPRGGMPNVDTGTDKQNFAYNNGRGFDVYESSRDGMPVLKPDADNRKTLGMPVK